MFHPLHLQATVQGPIPVQGPILASGGAPLAGELAPSARNILVLHKYLSPSGLWPTVCCHLIACTPDQLGLAVRSLHLDAAPTTHCTCAKGGNRGSCTRQVMCNPFQARAVLTTQAS